MSWFSRNRTQFLKNAPQALETTVTFLEMTERPAQRHAKPGNINAMLLVVRDIPLEFYRYIYFQVGIPWNWEARLRLTDQELATLVHAHETQITILYLDGAPAGFFEINKAHRDRTDLAYFGLMPHAFGRGLGKWFLSAAIDACWADNPPKITVNTCTLDHPAALPLYQKLGFRPYRQATGKIRPLSDMERAALAAKSGIINP